jgi:flagellar biosynthesis protein FlhF
MRIKKFTGATLKEATDLMKSELGAEAIILGTRKVARGGVLNFLGKEEFEITAAIDDQAASPARPTAAFAGALADAQRATPAAVSAESTLASLQQVARHFEERAKKKLASEPASALETAPYRELRDEVESLRSIVQEVAVHLKHTRMPALPEHLKNAYLTLVGQGVDEQLAAELTQRVYRSMGEDVLESKHLVEQSLVKEMASMFTTASPSETITRKPKVIALVGPTGVGKTTTIAKLAAIQKLMKGQNVALISADTYRIGAIEQLRMFAAIANIPMQVVYEPSEMRTALARLGERDVVFIDTVGRSQRVAQEITEIGNFVAAANPHEVHLVISASSADQVIKEAVENFRKVGPNRIIFSKLDEAVAYGQLLNVAHLSGLPISYLTTGQNVPDDIALADNMQLAGMVFTGELLHA